MKRRTETWHMVSILQYLENVRTQDEICKKTGIHHNVLRRYLKKFKKLGMIVNVKNRQNGIKRNAMAILWHVTDLGRDYKVVIRKYVNA